jgi:ankyrin repeat protein
LFKAIGKGDTSAMRIYFQRHAAPDSSTWRNRNNGISGVKRRVLDASGNNADLIRAIQFGDTATVRLMLQGGRDPNDPGYAGELPLVAAAEAHNGSSLRLLLDHGAKPDRSDFLDHTPLMLAAQSGDSARVRLLLDLGANPNHAVRSEGGAMRAVEVGRTPLFFACKRGSLAVVRLLVSRGADVNHVVVNHQAEWENGMTPAMTAAERGHPEIVAFLVNSGARADPRSLDEALLRGASLRGDAVQVRALLQKGVRVDARKQVLLEAGGKQLELERTPLLTAIDGRLREPNDRKPSIEVVRLLIAAGADVNAEVGTTALGMAVMANEPAIVRLLLDSGARARAKPKNGWGQSALELAKEGVKNGWPGYQALFDMLKNAK